MNSPLPLPLPRARKAVRSDSRASLFGRIGLKRRERADRPEKRSYTSAREQQLVEAASGAVETDARNTAVAEACAGLVSRAFASARVDGPAAVTPDVLGLIGRQLVLRGEVVLALEVDDVGLRLAPVAFWDVQGGPDPSSWWYRCDLFGPSGNWTRTLPSAGVVHCKWSWDPAFPWRGIGPLARARDTARMLGALTVSVGDEGSAPVGHLIPVPDVGTDDGSDDDESDPMADLRNDLRNLRGGLALVPTTASGFGSRTEAPRNDWDPIRFGPNPPAAVAPLIDDAARATMAAVGVPIDLLVKSDGTTLRESWRRFVHSTVQPLARIVEAELSDKLEAQVGLDFAPLHASDVAGRARAFGILVQSGLSTSDALDVSGLNEAEE